MTKSCGYETAPIAIIKMGQCTSDRKVTRMARKLPDACSTSAPKSSPTTMTTETNQAKRCMKPGPIVRNPYLNFLREYRQKFCGLSAIETVRQGAKAWNNLPKEERVRYIVEAYYAPKQRRRRRRLRKSNGSVVSRHRLASVRKSEVRVRSARKTKIS